MDDKIISSDNASEYKFSDSEGGEQINVPVDDGLQNEVKPQAAKFNVPSINWKRFTVPGAIIVAVMFVYAVSSFYTAKKTTTLENQKTMAQDDAALLQQQQLISATAKSTPNVENNNDQQIAQMQGAVQQEMDTVLQQVKSGQGSISNMTNMVTKTQQDVAIVGKQVEQLTAVMQQMLAEIDKLKATKKARSPKKKRSFKLPVAYHVRAIVPGRVWLESAKGDSISLRVGDKLEGYGTVNAIVPDKGMAVMSNGSIIQYGVDDF